MLLLHQRNESEMIEVVFTGLIVVGVLIVLPILAYFVSKHWELGRLKGRDAYRQYQRGEFCKRNRLDIDGLDLLRKLGSK